MSEAVKTLIFLAVAVVMGGLAYVSRPAPATSTPEEEVNQPLFPEFTDPLQAESMQVTRFDSDRGQIRRFEVANTKEGWQIKTKGGYPANATQHMTKAANSLVDLKVLRIVSDLPGQQAEYGVVEPNANAISAADEGVGQMVTINGKSDKKLANLIIGAADKEDPQLHYVRVPGRDRIYLVRLDPTVFSTEFSDWIDKDLLQLNPFDVTSLRFRNYTTQAANNRLTVLPQMDATVAFNAERSDWRLLSLQETAPNDPTQLTAAELPASDKLNVEKLDEIRNSLDDLTIVDVYRKPEQLAEALKKGEGVKEFNQEDLPALFANGFFGYTLPGETEPKLIGMNGELVIETQDAIRYRLLFGLESLGGDDKNQKQQFLFVQTELVDEMLPPPMLQEVPEIKEGEDQDIEAQAKARERILQENDAAMIAYREKKNIATQKIFELNTRFADWYYVVKAEDVAKILLKRDQLGTPINQPTNQPSGAPGRVFPGGPGMGMMRPPAAQQPAAQPMLQPEATDKPNDKEAPKEEPPAEEKPADAPVEPMKPAEVKAEPAVEEKPAATEETPDAAAEGDKPAEDSGQ
ncbi:hypothetical protein C5Y96_15630 [Blastopirellula marina]|uniref:DUF4340 domain-containing protein n=1 Tax=Blastopirellula marina TaxID=124 RepID=A0A2S8FAM8_9BACT|nr:MULTISPECIES: DUF4340 domain-containing protein [Pirellulaceae]PQO29180.1 hypothetical protein C5Y96_15630 [Blastopirellula marina]RCS50373.1 DUF4340 domain-containing protein [Bremerella cremea]